MKQGQWIQKLLLSSITAVFLLPLSLFADGSPQQWTESLHADVRVQPDHRRLEGVVLHVSSDGDTFLLETTRERVRIDARGGVAAYYQGRRYRIRDLERGDRVLVELRSSSSRRPRARSVEVLYSVSHDGRHRRNPGIDHRIEGRVVSLDHARNLMLVRVDRRQEVRVDLGRLHRSDRRWHNQIRVGDVVRIEGIFDGRIFRAHSLHPAQWNDRDDGWRRR